MRLVVYLDDIQRKVVSIGEQEIRIGRGAENELALDDPKISRLHCRVFVQKNVTWIEDQGSANGTYVNGRPADRVALRPGDQIELGPFRLVVEDEAAASLIELPGKTQTLPGKRRATSKTSELDSLLSVLESFDVDLPRDELLPKILGALLTTLDGERTFLHRYDTKRSRMRLVFDHAAPGADAKLPVSESLIQKVAKEREPLLVTGLVGHAGEELPSLDRLARANLQSIVVAPLTLGRKLVGILYVDSRERKRAFTTQDLEVLSRAGEYLAGILESVETKKELTQENQRLKHLLREGPSREVPLDALMAAGSPMRKSLDLVKKAAPMDVTILIGGETGTGKEETARMVHRLSARADGAFIPINCGAIPESLVESELFGHKRGAFSGADEDRAGLLELAEGGTLFLDEVGELPLPAQVKLLRVLAERRVTRLGSGESTPVDFRLVAATHRDLEKQVKEGTFREDLLYRLKVFPLQLPPLRERRMDLAAIAGYLVESMARQLGSKVRQVSPEAIEMLGKYAWPGNIRELRNVLERALVLEESDILTPASLPREILEPGPAPAASGAGGGTADDVRRYADEQAAFERDYFRRLRKKVGDNISAMARVSGISRFTLYRKLGQIGLDGKLPPPGGDDEESE